MKILASKFVKLPPVMLKFDPETVSSEATELIGSTQLARLKEILMSKQKELPPNLSVSVKDFKILKAYFMPGMTADILKTAPKLLYKCVPGKLEQPSGAASPFVMRAATFANGPKRPVRVGDKGNMWVMNRPTGVHTPKGTQPGNESDVYANAYNPLILCIIEITTVV